MVLTILKHISQWEGLSRILWEIKKCWKPPASTGPFHFGVPYWRHFQQRERILNITPRSVVNMCNLHNCMTPNKQPAISTCSFWATMGNCSGERLCSENVHLPLSQWWHVRKKKDPWNFSESQSGNTATTRRQHVTRIMCLKGMASSLQHHYNHVNGTGHGRSFCATDYHLDLQQLQFLIQRSNVPL